MRLWKSHGEQGKMTLGAPGSPLSGPGIALGARVPEVFLDNTEIRGLLQHQNPERCSIHLISL